MGKLDSIDEITGARSTLARLGTVTALDRQSTVGEFLAKAQKKDHVVEDGLGTLAGAVAGAIVGMRYGSPVLGGIEGASLGRNLPALLKPEERRDALCNMGITGTAVIGAKMFPVHPVIGFGLGWLTAGAVVYFGKLRTA